MNALSVSILLGSSAFACVGLYLVMTPTRELLRGGGPDFEPNALDRSFPLWRRLSGGVVLLVSIGVIAAVLYG